MKLIGRYFLHPNPLDSFSDQIDVQEVEISGDLAYSRDQFNRSLLPKTSGSAMSMTGKEIVICRRLMSGYGEVASMNQVLQTYEAAAARNCSYYRQSVCGAAQLTLNTLGIHQMGR